MREARPLHGQLQVQGSSPNLELKTSGSSFHLQDGTREISLCHHGRYIRPNVLRCWSPDRLPAVVDGPVLQCLVPMGANCSCHGLVWVRQGLCPMRLSGGPAHPWRRRRARWRWCRPRPRPRDPLGNAEVQQWAKRKTKWGSANMARGLRPQCRKGRWMESVSSLLWAHLASF